MTERVDPPATGSETEVLLGFLEWHRETLVGQCAGLDADQLAARLAPSTMTLGGMLTHLAFVEDYWFGYLVSGDEPVEPWRSSDWDADPDADWHLDATPDEARALLADAFARSRRVTAEVLARPGGIETLSARERGGERVSLRYVLVHLLEEYSRHNGHADLLRESIDGTVGE